MTKAEIVNEISKQTGIKHCTSKTGKSFDCRFAMDENKVVKFVFEDKRKN